jgi:hypothetical protein
MRSIGYARLPLRGASDRILHLCALAAIVMTIATAIILALRIGTHAHPLQVSAAPLATSCPDETWPIFVWDATMNLQIIGAASGLFRPIGFRKQQLPRPTSRSNIGRPTTPTQPRSAGPTPAKSKPVCALAGRRKRSPLPRRRQHGTDTYAGQVGGLRRCRQQLVPTRAGRLIMLRAPASPAAMPDSKFLRHRPSHQRRIASRASEEASTQFID